MYQITNCFLPDRYLRQHYSAQSLPDNLCSVEEYKRLHKLMTGITARHIWDELRAGRNLDEIIGRVPDEYYQWVQSVENDLRAEYAVIEAQCRADFKELPTRKDTALYFQTCAHPPVLFSMLDNKDYSQHIWKQLRPQSLRAFRRDIDAL